MALKKNTASQVIGAQMVSASDGSAFTGSVTVVVTVDGGTQSASGGTGPTHEGNGFHSYIPTQAETNGDHIAFTFTGTGAVPVTIQVYTTFPQTGDSFARLGAPAGASVSADIATVDGVVDAILLDTGTDGVVVAAGSKTGYTISGTITTLDALDTAQDSQHATTQSAIAALNDLDAAGVAGAVWNAATATYGTAGSYGLLVETNLDAAVSTAGGDDAATIWTYATRVLTANTNLNDPTAAQIRAEIDSNSTQLAAIVADTNELQTDWANGGRLDLILDARASQTTADAIEADTQDIQSRIPAALVGGRIDANIGAISASQAAADQLELNVEASLAGTASGTPTTTSMVSDIAVTVDDQFKGRVIIFQSDTTTAALRNQATDITACTASSNTLTFTALTTAPSSGDTFLIL